VNPPVLAWAVWQVFEIERAAIGGDADGRRLEGRRDRLHLVGVLGDDLVRGRERVPRGVLGQLGEPILHLFPGVVLGDELVGLDVRVLVELELDGVDLLRRRLGAARELRAEVDVDDQVLLHVVRPGDDPASEGDEEAEQEHADEDGHDRGDARGEIGGDGAEGLGDEESRAHQRGTI